jgi:GNAT superfamily N-acetyltransferase
MSNSNISYPIRRARFDEMQLLLEIESAAGSMFSGLGIVDEALDQPFPLDKLHTLVLSGQVWVCCRDDDTPVGMAIASVWGKTIYIEEMDVLPSHGRRGLGTRLLRHVCSWAKSQGGRAVLLSTFRDVPWNGPFYKKNGFRELSPEHCTKRLRSIRENERRCGLSVDARVFMRLDLSSFREDL